MSTKSIHSSRYLVTSDYVNKLDNKVNTDIKCAIDIIKTLKRHHDVSTLDFETSKTYCKFVELVRKIEVSTQDSSFYTKFIKVFKKSRGLPEELFDQELDVQLEGKASLRFSKYLFLKRYPHLKDCIDQKNNKFCLKFLSTESLQLFKLFIYGQKLTSSIPANQLLELIHFARWMNDEKLENKAFQILFNNHFNKDDEANFDPAIFADCASEFTNLYLSSVGIDQKFFLLNGSLEIGLKDFIRLFENRSSPVLNFIKDNIDCVFWEKADLTLLPFVDESYRNAILHINLIETDEEPDINSFKTLAQCFPNAEFTPEFLQSLELTTQRSAITCYARGLLSSSQEDFENAEASFREGLAIKPENSFCHEGLSQILSSPRRSRERLDHLRSSNPRKASTNSQLGAIYMTHKPINSKNHFTTALKQNPKQTSSLLRLALLMKKSGKLFKSQKLFVKLLKLNPQCNLEIELIFELISILKNKKLIDSSIKYLIHSTKFNPENALAIAALGEIYRKMGNFSEAEVLLRKACQLAPRAESYVSLAKTLLAAGKDSANIYLNKALSLDPNHKRANRVFAHLLRKNNASFFDTLARYDIAFKSDPKDNNLLQALKEYIIEYTETNYEDYFLEEENALLKALEYFLKHPSVAATIYDLFQADSELNASFCLQKLKEFYDPSVFEEIERNDIVQKVFHDQSVEGENDAHRLDLSRESKNKILNISSDIQANIQQNSDLDSNLSVEEEEEEEEEEEYADFLDLSSDVPGTPSELPTNIQQNSALDSNLSIEEEEEEEEEYANFRDLSSYVPGTPSDLPTDIQKNSALDSNLSIEEEEEEEEEYADFLDLSSYVPGTPSDLPTDIQKNSALHANPSNIERKEYDELLDLSLIGENQSPDTLSSLQTLMQQSTALEPEVSKNISPDVSLDESISQPAAVSFSYEYPPTLILSQRKIREEPEKKRYKSGN